MNKQHIELTPTDREHLQAVIKQKDVKARTLKRAMILLALDRGESMPTIAEFQNVSQQTIYNLKNRYKEQGLKCLQDAPRSGRPVEIDGEQRAKITALACSEAPEGHSQWSLRLLADRVVELEYCEAISHTQVGNILKKTTFSHT